MMKLIFSTWLTISACNFRMCTRWRCFTALERAELESLIDTL